MAQLIGNKKIKTAVFISGTGSNLKSLINFSKLKNSPISIKLIISNNDKAKGLIFAKRYKIKKKIFNFKRNILVDRKLILLLLKFKSKEVNSIELKYLPSSARQIIILLTGILLILKLLDSLIMRSGILFLY